MSPTSKHLFDMALTLSEGERLDLAAALLAASEPPTPQPTGDRWLAELERRSNEIDQGTVSCVSWEQVKQSTRSRHGD